MKSRDWLVNLSTILVTVCTVVVSSLFVYRQFVPQKAVAQGAALPSNRKVSDWREQEALGRRIGRAGAKLTILEYADFECPACLGFFREVEKVRAAQPNDISIAFRHFPLKYHKQAYPSARAAECAADQSAFENMYVTLYNAHDSLGRVPFRELARRAGVRDLKAFDTCFADTSRVARIEADLKAGEITQIPGTPGLIIDGTLWQERIPKAADLEQMIRAKKGS